MGSESNFGELVTGGDRFKAEIEIALNQRMQPGQRGRPRTQADTNLSREKANGQQSFMERL
ncbi:MAG: hypothetical protein D4R48_02540 [Nitrosomonadales bacterium]|nr:MAG: hypothetical protein D4R48_02540 [Nitrosomonadales bacterium]